MNYQRVLVGVAIGAAVAGLGFLIFHPNGKQMRRKAMDLGLDAADKVIDMLRTNIRSAAAESATVESEPSTQRRRQAPQPVTES